MDTGKYDNCLVNLISFSYLTINLLMNFDHGAIPAATKEIQKENGFTEV